MDDLCDALDGYDVAADLSETDGDEKPLALEKKDTILSDGQEKGEKHKKRKGKEFEEDSPPSPRGNSKKKTKMNLKGKHKKS